MTAILPFLMAALGWGRTAFTALLRFASQPPGSYITAAALVALAVWGSGQLGWHRGRIAGQATCEAAHAAAAAKEHTRQARAMDAAVRASEARTAESAARDLQNREIVSHVKIAAASLPPVPAGCPLAVPAALADGLRGLQN